MLMRMRSFWFGFTLPLRSLRLILAHSRLIAWSALPIALTLVLYSYLIRSLNSSLKSALTHSFLTLGWSPHGITAAILFLITKLTLFLLGAFSFSVVAAMMASPFNDFLAESSEYFSEPRLTKVPRSGFAAKLRLISIDLLKTVAAGIITLAALVFSWVPILNGIAFVLAVLLITFQYISYPQTRRGQGILSGIGFLWNHFYASFGFGLAMLGLFAVPFLSSFCLPLAVVGGTLLFARASGGPLK